MQTLWYYAAVLLAKTLMALPIRLVALLGRCGGGIAYFVDARHRRVALTNLQQCFGELSEAERRAVAREHFRRLGENYASAIATAGMTDAELMEHLEVIGAEKLAANQRGAIIAVGHFGNFELYARIGPQIPHFRPATTYRALKQPRLDKLVRELRGRSGCLLFDRRREIKPMLRALRSGRIALGLLSDQHNGRRGARLPFLGHDCSTTLAPAILARRFGLPLFTAVCFRVGLAQWQIEFGDEIPSREGESHREFEAIMRDVNAAFEAAVRRDPANWLWVHDRWRFVKQQPVRPLGATVQKQAAPRERGVRVPAARV